jgi:DNA topoisomerase-1
MRRMEDFSSLARDSETARRHVLVPPADSEEAAHSARLRYVGDDTPGITRRRAGKGFAYRYPDGSPVRDPGELDRIRAIVIPPAWTDVWICPYPNGHIQATGRDARGRKQYRYHPRWRAVRDETKYEHMLSFGQALPRIRRRVAADLERTGLPREKVLAAVVRLLERTLARVGNPEYAKENHSFGLTTLQNRHMRAVGGRIELDFRTKHGLRHHSVVSDRKLARILKRCRDLPGSELFQYLDEEGRRHTIDSADLNDYLRLIAGRDVTAKDFRTWAATNLAMLAIAERGTAPPSKRAVAQVVRQVAEQLGNTPTVCRNCYIHPRVLDAYLDGTLAPFIAALGSGEKEPDMWAVEATVMRLLAAQELSR